MKKVNIKLSMLIFISMIFVAKGQYELPSDIHKLNSLRNKYSIDDLNLENVENENLEAHSNKLIDSTENTFDTLKNEKSSVFEQITQGITIHPDSLLPSLTVFGLSTFNNSSINNSNIPFNVPSNYTIAPSDEIHVTIWGRINETHKLKVKRNGQIDLPKIGPINASGLTFKSLKLNIENEVKKITGVQATVSMGSLSDISIYIVGEIKKPGKHTIPALSSITDALINAKGFKETASLRNINIKRGNRIIKNVDLYKLLLSGYNYSNFRLLSGDVIYVPVASNVVSIAGNVKRSAIYELKGKKSTLQDLINLSGGFLASAWNNNVEIERFNQNNEKIILNISSDSLHVNLIDGDIVKVYPILKVDEKAIYLEGNVKRPGKYEFFEGIKISDILNSYDNLLPESFLKYSTIYRLSDNGQTVRLIPFNLDSIITNIDFVGNLPLKPKDKIVVYNRSLFEPERKVSIGGAVTKTGDFDLLHNMRIKDLILASGGLDISASFSKGELYRRTYVGDSVHTEKIDFNIQEAMNGNLDENWLLSKGDHIFIRTKRGWERQKKITLLGEFNFPGQYVILENETLGEILQRAGGFKRNANLDGSIYTRNSVKKLEKKRTIEYINNLEKEMLSLTSIMVSRDAAAATQAVALLEQQKVMLEKLKSTEPIGRLVIDMTDSDNYDDLQIEDGDTLYVPKITKMVSVLGEVFNPATFILEKRGNNSAKNYIENAGGYKESANKKDVYIIKANGSVRTKKMVSMRRYDLSSGDVVIIPKKLPFNTGRFKIFMSTLDVITRLASITASTVSTIALVKEISKNDTN